MMQTLNGLLLTGNPITETGKKYVIDRLGKNKVSEFHQNQYAHAREYFFQPRLFFSGYNDHVNG